MRFSDQQATDLEVGEMRLFTNELMTENPIFYGNLGYQETERRTEGPYRRVYLRKMLG